MFDKWFSHSANDLCIQQKNYIFSNMKFVFSNMRHIFSNLRSAFNETKFIKQKLFTFITRFGCNKIYIQKHLAEWKIWRSTLFLFTVHLVKELMPRTGLGVGVWAHACERPQGFCMNITKVYAYSLLAETCSKMCF